MLHMILLILKILGILLAVVLGALLLTLLAVLFSAVRYRIRASYFERPEGQAFFSWLFRLVTASLIYKEKAELTVRILGIPVFSRIMFSEEELEEKLESGPETVQTAELTGKRVTPPPLKEKKEPPRNRRGRTEGGKNQEKSVPEKKKAAAGPEKTPKEEKKPEEAVLTGPAARLFRKIQDRLQGIFSRVRSRLADLVRRLRAAQNKLQRLQAFWEDEENRRTLSLLWKQTKRLLRHLFPRKIKGRLRFGLEDPYRVGQILCLASPFYGFYGKSFALEPVFDEKILEGEAEIRGHIRLGTLAFIILRVFANKNFRVLLKKWRT